MGGPVMGERLWAVCCSVVVLGALVGSPAAKAATEDISLATYAKPKFAFEQAQRINGLTLQFGNDTFAPHNAIGQSLQSNVQPQIQDSLTADVNNGATSLLFEMRGLADLTGTNASSLTVGALDGSPIEPAGNPVTYKGNSDLDWWYTPALSEISATGTPKHQLNGSIVNHALTATGSEATLAFNGFLGPQSLSSVKLAATTGTSSAPLTSTNGFPPGHLPSENIPAALQSFTTMSTGQLSANVSAASLAATPIPASLATLCAGYTSSNSLLDVFVSGCTHIVTLISATQPDQIDPSVPAAGAGGPYVLKQTSHAVTGCFDKTLTAVPLPSCLTAAAYSIYFTFTTDRVIVRNPNVVVKPTRGTPQAPVVVSGSGFKPGETVRVMYKTGLVSPNPRSVTLCATPATANGTFSCAARIPNATKAGAVGRHTVVAKGLTSHLHATARVTLT